MVKTKKAVSNKDEIFMVESILGKTYKDGIAMYKVKWEGYPLYKSTWEPEWHLHEQLVKRYNESVTKGIPFSETKDEDDNEGEGDKVSEMREILSKRNRGRAFQYRVKYDDGNEKWLPESSITRRSLIHAYEAKNPKKLGRKRKFSTLFSTEQSSKAPGNKIARVRMDSVDLGPPKYGRKCIPGKGGEDISEALTPVQNGQIPWTPTVTTPRSSKVLPSTQLLNNVTQRNKTTKEFESEAKQQNVVKRTFKSIPQGEKKIEESQCKQQSSATFKKKATKITDCLLDRVMKVARKGTKYSEDEILGVLGVQNNKNKEKFYLIQLTNKDAVAVHSDDIPAKFRNECLRLDNKSSFG